MRNYIKKSIAFLLVLVFLAPLPLLAITITVGKTSNGASTTNSTSAGIRIAPYTSGQTASGKIIAGHGRFWLNGAGTTGTKLVIYSDVAGVPTNLLAYSDEVVISNTSEAQIDYTFSGVNQISLTSNTTYWIGVQQDSPTGGVGFVWSRDATVGVRNTMFTTYGATPPATFTIGSTGDGYIDVFIDFEEQLGATHTLTNPGRNNSGLSRSFDGVNEAGISGDNPTGNTDTVGSMVCWVTFDTILAGTGTKSIFAMGGTDTDQAVNYGQIALILRREASYVNRLELFHRVDNSGTANRIVGNTTIAANTLYMVSATSTGTTWAMYLNASAQTLTVASGSNTGDWFGDVGTVGNRRYSIADNYRDGVFPAAWLNGDIDNCFTTNTTLSSTDITNLYNGGKPVHPCVIISCADIRVFYKLGEDDNGSASTTPAAIGTANDQMNWQNMESGDIVRTSYY